MSPLEPPDSHHASAAIGWLELGNHVEAGEELARIRAPSLEHPDVLEGRWAVFAAGRSWDGALGAVELLLDKGPHRVFGWVHGAYELARVKAGGLPMAWEARR